MINDKITDKELEMFAAEPENNLAFAPNHAMAQKMAKELLAHRKAWREPVGYINPLYFGEFMRGCTLHKEPRKINLVPLYRKPDTGEV